MTFPRLLCLMATLAASISIGFARSPLKTTYAGGSVSDRDCNRNGIGDRRDRAMGIFEDRNGDGVDDWCQSDSTLTELRRTLGRTIGVDPESAYVGVEYVADRGIILKCSAPSKDGIRIRAVDGASSTLWEIEPRSERGGSREVLWVPRYPFGSPIRRGRADVEFVVGNRSYWKVVAWDWTSFEGH